MRKMKKVMRFSISVILVLSLILGNAMGVSANDGKSKKSQPTEKKPIRVMVLVDDPEMFYYPAEGAEIKDLKLVTTGSAAGEKSYKGTTNKFGYVDFQIDKSINKMNNVTLSYGNDTYKFQKIYAMDAVGFYYPTTKIEGNRTYYLFVGPKKTERPTETEQPVESERPIESEAPVESEQPIESEKPVESERPVESEKPAETKSPVESEKPAETKGPAKQKTDDTVKPVININDNNTPAGPTVGEGNVFNIEDNNTPATGDGKMVDVKIDKTPASSADTLPETGTTSPVSFYLLGFAMLTCGLITIFKMKTKHA